MWTIYCHSDPVPSIRLNGKKLPFGLLHSTIVQARISITNFFIANPAQCSIFQQIVEREARVALADFCVRYLLEQQNHENLFITTKNGFRIALEPMDKAITKKRQNKTKKTQQNYLPYVLDRTDAWCTQSDLNLMVRMMVYDTANLSAKSHVHDEKKIDGRETMMELDSNEEVVVKDAAREILAKVFDAGNMDLLSNVMKHVASVTLQQRLRSQLKELHAVAFISDGAILPRKSGASELPMTSPPAVPFQAPEGSKMSKRVIVDMGSLRDYLPNDIPSSSKDISSTTVTISGLVVPMGITLVVGGGYHGKSTLLRAIAAGVYDKIPGDGREYCVAVRDAVSVRAEDGRYVNNCNVSAFISNLPTPKGIDKAPDTKHFSSCNASGSTSQAANVSEAIEMGASALLVDEDVSAANFMARDGRMRALVMDESITPLLYRVNGLYDRHGISSVVVVGGVGDWLDVPHHVILLNRYEASDATEKAQSVSRQFSYGHVQYAGRGVVHRLEWDKHGTPIPRRPTDAFTFNYGPEDVISLLDSGHAIAVHPKYDNSIISNGEDDSMEEETNDQDDDEGCIDTSRLEQLLSKQQLYGCGLCVSWVLRTAPKQPTLGLSSLLKLLDETVDQQGMLSLFGDGSHQIPQSVVLDQLVESIGYAQRPRRFEVGQALTRLRGLKLEELPVEDDGADEKAEREAELRKKELAAMWAARRKK